jgi:site-specific recombinase XerD
MNEITLSQSQPLDQNAAAVYVASLPAQSGQRTQAQALRVIAQALGTELDRVNWGALRYQHTAAIRAKLAQSYSPATANKMLSALRQTLKQAWLLGQMTAEEYSRAVELEPVTGETLPAGRELSTGEILALMQACQSDDTNAGTRDAAIIGLMYAAGLRRDEVVKLEVSSYDEGKLTLTGKRSKQRTAYVTNGAKQALEDWLTIRGTQDGALFVEVDKAGKVLTERQSMVVKPSRKIRGVDVPNKKAGQKIHRGGAITSQAIYNMLAKRAEEAGIKAFSPHDMRRTLYLTCSTRAQTSPLSQRWPVMPTYRLPPVTTAGRRTQSAKRRNCCTSPIQKGKLKKSPSRNGGAYTLTSCLPQ